MNCKIALAVVCLFGLTLFAHGLDEGWLRVADVSPLKDSVSFTIGLHWRNTHLLDDFEAGIAQSAATGTTPTFEHEETREIDATRASLGGGSKAIGATVAKWRGHLAPLDSDFNAVFAKLGSAATAHCKKATWDTIRCVNVPVQSAAKILGTATSNFARYSHPDGAEEGVRVFCVKCSSKKIIAELKLSTAVAHITDLTPPPLAKWVRPPQKSAESTFKTAKAQKGTQKQHAESAPSVSARKMKKLDDSVTRWWPRPTDGTGEPIILSLGATHSSTEEANTLTVVLALYCSTGSQFQAGFGSTFCDGTGSEPFMIRVLGQDYPISVVNVVRFGKLEKKAPYANEDQAVAILRINPLNNTAWKHFTADDLGIQIQFQDLSWSNKATTVNFDNSVWQNTTVPAISNPGPHPFQSSVFAEKPMWGSDIRTLYALPQASSDSSISQGVWEFSIPGLPISYQKTDVMTYLVDYDQGTWSADMIEYIGSLDGVSGGEATLDIELITSLASVKTFFYTSTDPNVSILNSMCLAEALLLWVRDLADPKEESLRTFAPSVWSVSYGQCETTCEDTVEEVNRHLRLLTASGVTFVVSSGDAGSCCGGVQVPFMGLNFPASSPYVTSVGATALRGNTVDDQVGCSAHFSELITSSGGFSTTQKTPGYQKSVLSNSATAQRHAGYRAVPDVAALGSNIAIIQNGQTTNVFGTSASAPIVAGMITLLNLQLAKTIAFANHFLYAHASPSSNVLSQPAYIDITEGNNCYSRANYGLSNAFPTFLECFEASSGWDPVTGLGTPLARVLALSLNNYTAPTLPPSPHKSKSSKTPVVVGVVVVIAGGAIVALVVVLIIRRNRRRREQQQPLMQQQPINYAQSDASSMQSGYQGQQHYQQSPYGQPPAPGAYGASSV